MSETEDKKPTTIRPSASILGKVEYLKLRLDLESLSAVLWYCVNRVYRSEKIREEKEKK
jgi:hypothetical protein